MTYDQWKATDPRDYEPEEADPQDEREHLCVELQASQAEARKYREALLGLYAVVKALACPGGLSTEVLQRYLEANFAVNYAATVLGCDRLDDPKF